MKQTFLQKLYMYSLVAALILHVFNDIEIGGGLKLFHVPAACAFITSFFLPKDKDNIFKLVWGFIAISLFSSFVSPWDGSFLKAITFLIIVGSTLGARYVNSDLLIKNLNICIPIAILPLVRHYFSDVWYRYQGFYEDPNYMCTTLIVFLFIVLIGFTRYDNKYVKVALITEILLIIFLVSTTISRTGLVCTGIVLLVAFWDFFKAHKIQSIVVLVVVAGIVLYSRPDLVENAISGYVLREDNSDNLQSASSLRREISMRGIEFVMTHPLYIFQGIGVGAAAHHEGIEGFIAHSAHGDHNTITSSLTEQGLIGFFLFIAFLINVFKRIWKMPRIGTERSISLVVFISIFLFSMSINDMLYLPYWFLMFYLSREEV